MEHEVWLGIVRLVDRVVKDQMTARYTYTVREIVLVYFWAALHERPIYWACRPGNWPAASRPRRLPVPSTMTRRLRRPEVRDALLRLERQSRGRPRRELVSIVDGKPLPISNHSTDPDAGYGRGAGGKAKGYRLHMIVQRNGVIRAWAVRPIQHDEAKVAATLLPSANLNGYLLADANYDRNALYDACLQRGVQLLAGRRYGEGRGMGHHYHSPARRRAIEMMEVSPTGFATRLLKERRNIERLFGAFASCAFGLPSLPPWIRGLSRVERWVCAKLIVWNCSRRTRTKVA